MPQAIKCTMNLCCCNVLVWVVGWSKNGLRSNLRAQNYLGDHTLAAVWSQSCALPPFPPPFCSLCTFCSTCEQWLIYHYIMHTSSEHKSIQLRLYTALLKHLFELKLMAFLGIVICMSVHIWRLLFSHTNLTRMGSQFEALYTYSNICSLVVWSDDTISKYGTSYTPSCVFIQEWIL